MIEADLARRQRRARKPASCHGAASGAGPAGAPVVALVGSPNVGKSTLFNALTGASVTTGNWPGTTVEVSRGAWHTKRTGGRCSCATRCCDEGECRCKSDAHDLGVIDLPGAYSFDSLSPDEALTRELIADVPVSEAPDVTVAVVDSAHLARSLYLVSQLRELPLRVVVALTMGDVAERRGIVVDAAALSRALGVPVVQVDPRRRDGLTDLTRVVQDSLDCPAPGVRSVELDESDDPELAREDERFEFVDRACRASLTMSDDSGQTFSDKVDRWVTAPVIGPLIFLAIMWLVFQITTTVAAPLQDALANFFDGPVTDAATSLLGSVGLADSWVQGLIVDGLIAGVGSVLSFVPLMALMFCLLALLEDSGYLARGAVVTDSAMRRIGLPGKAFLPLVVGFGCNVPAISATRILANPRQRILTSLLVPFTSCSARLVVYVMIGTVFFGRWAGTVVFAMYVLSILMVLAVGFLLRKTLWRTMGDEPLVLDLPPYQRPTWRVTGAVTWTRLKGFLQSASGIIVAAVAGVWLLQSIPAVAGFGFGEVPVEDSVYGAVAQQIAVVFRPTGFAAWQTVSALVVGFVAKEAVVSSWAQTFAAAEESADLHTALMTSFVESSGGHPTAAALAFLVFLLAYTPCVATLGAQRREIGGRWTAFGVVMQLIVAYVLAVVVFQIASIWL